MDRRVHKRYLDYRERYVYFGRNKPLLSAVDFERLSDEANLLQARGEERDDEDEERFALLLEVLLLD
jgi:hypothetical protein